MKISFNNIRRPVTSSDISKYQIQFDRTVPEELKSFQLNGGTGLPSKEIFYPTPEREDTEGIGVTFFYDYDPKAHSSIAHKTLFLAKFNHDIAKNVIPFIRSIDGFDFAIGCTEHNLGEIFLLDWQHYDHPSIELIEKNLSDFLDKLEEEPIV